MLVEHFISQVGVKGNAQQERFAHKFAVAYAAGVIAAEEHIAPWDSRHVGRCVASVYQWARCAMGGAEEQSPAILNRIAQAIRAGRFPVVRKGEALPPCAARIWGIRHDIGEERVFALRLSEVDRLAGNRGRRARSCRLLGRERPRGALARWQEYAAAAGQPAESDQRQRLVCLKRSAFQVSGRAN